MSSTASIVAKFAVAGGLLIAGPALATHHLWEIVEVFSSADGTIQFIELHTTFTAQNFLQGVDLSSSCHTYTIPANLPSSVTANKRVLFATPGFAALPGAPAPDYIIPGPFFDPYDATITINLVSSDILTFSSTALPTDCVNSLHATAGGSLSIGAMTPTNFAGLSGSVAGQCGTACPADINGNNVVNVTDMLAVINAWGACAAQCPADIAPLCGDDQVNVADLLATINAWGSCP